jgi:hypothetical protein
MSASGPVPKPWWLLGLFAFSYGALEWLELAAWSAGDAPGFQLARALFRAVSFAFLLEFARRTSRTLARRTVGPWIHAALGLLVVAACLAWGWRYLDSASRLALAAPASFWTAGLLAIAARRTPDLGGGAAARRARAGAAIFLVLFGLTAGLVVRPAPFLPPGWPTTDGFLASVDRGDVAATRTTMAALLAGMADHFVHEEGWMGRYP